MARAKRIAKNMGNRAAAEAYMNNVYRRFQAEASARVHG